jgi:mTERF domain-containing protein
VNVCRWMKHNHITYPRVGKLVDLKGEDLDRLRERIGFLKKNYVRGRDLGVVLTRHPVILDRPLEELQSLVQLLEDAGVQRSWVGFVICRSPGVLAHSVDELLDKISFFQGLGVRAKYFGPMAFNFPASIGRFPLSEMQAKVRVWFVCFFWTPEL